MLTCEIQGAYNFRHATLDVSITAEYDRDGYFDILSMKAKSTRRGKYVPVSDPLMWQFQKEKWDHLYGECLDHFNRACEIARDERIDNRRKEAA